jgi:cobalt/nickel transport system permease protein
MAVPAVVCFLLLNRYARSATPFIAMLAAFACGALAIVLSGLMVAACLVFSEESFREAAQIVLLAHIPVMVAEGVLTALIIGFLRKVKPEVLEAPYAKGKLQR